MIIIIIIIIIIILSSITVRRNKMLVTLRISRVQGTVKLQKSKMH